MRRIGTKWSAIPFAICLCVTVGQLCAQESADPALHIDIATRLKKAKDVRALQHLGFGGAALMATAIGAVALGGFAIVALAIGRLAIRRTAVERANFKSLEI